MDTEVFRERQMSETIVIALIAAVSTLIGGGASYLATRNAVMAKTAQDIASAAGSLIDPLSERIKNLETDMEKKIAEAYMVTRERDEQRLRIEKLECMVRTVIESFRAFIGTPKTAREREALKLLNEMEAEL